MRKASLKVKEKKSGTNQNEALEEERVRDEDGVGKKWGCGAVCLF